MPSRDGEPDADAFNSRKRSSVGLGVLHVVALRQLDHEAARLEAETSSACRTSATRSPCCRVARNVHCHGRPLPAETESSMHVSGCTRRRVPTASSTIRPILGIEMRPGMTMPRCGCLHRTRALIPKQLACVRSTTGWNSRRNSRRPAQRSCPAQQQAIVKCSCMWRLEDDERALPAAFRAVTLRCRRCAATVRRRRRPRAGTRCWRMNRSPCRRAAAAC